jgi:hypothetical protein
MASARHPALVAIFARPTRSDIRWVDIETLVRGLGGEVLEREGSRIAFIPNRTSAVFHRPHPRPTASKGAMDAVRHFLVPAAVKRG